MPAEIVLAEFHCLTAGERRDLLWLARAGIRAAVLGAPEPSLTDPSAALCAPAAAFVSLHAGGRLRGCIGTLVAEHPLHRTVVRMARSAALDDPRFPLLRAAELPGVSIEISRLSPPLPARAEEIEVGRHGVCLTYQERRAVFLPQVAPTHHWDRETLLTELCGKALLPADAWRRRGTSLLVFEAEIFGDRAPAAA